MVKRNVRGLCLVRQERCYHGSLMEFMKCWVAITMEQWITRLVLGHFRAYFVHLHEMTLEATINHTQRNGKKQVSHSVSILHEHYTVVES